jgi:hypothetical protein
MEIFDKFGHCILTGENLLEERVIDGKLQKVFKPNKTSMSFVLKDGSLMRVCVSKGAKELFKNTPEEMEVIMSRVKRGWEEEAKRLVKDKKWDEQKKDDYVEANSDKEIFARFDDIPVVNLTNIDEKLAVARKDMIEEARKEIDNGISPKR